jgi:hypothetical protein
MLQPARVLMAPVKEHYRLSGPSGKSRPVTIEQLSPIRGSEEALFGNSRCCNVNH